jgi:CheY-like chemotaxis protein
MGRVNKKVRAILLVDHITGRQNSIVKKLEQRNFAVAEVTTGRQAISILLSYPEELALVIVQANLPDMNPMDVVRHIRTDPKISNLPVVFSCIYLTGSLVQEAAGLGVNGLLATPARDKAEEFNDEFENLLKKLKTNSLDIKAA